MTATVFRNIKWLILCLIWLSATVIFKSDVSVMERIWFHFVSQLVFQYTYPAEQDRTHMTLLPFLEEKNNLNTGGRGVVKIEPATGKPEHDLEMLFFQQLLNRLKRVGDDNEMSSADAKGIKWSNDLGYSGNRSLSST